MKTIIRAFLPVCFLFSLTALASASDRQQITGIRVANYPHQYYQTKSGNWTGLDVKLARTLIKEADFKYDFYEYPRSRALNCIIKGKLHLMTSLSRTPERSTYMYWIGPERVSQMILVVNQRTFY